MTKYPEFRKALQDWRRAALKKLWSNADRSLINLGMERWRRDSDGHMRRRAAVQWDFRIEDELKQLPEWLRLVQTANETPDIAKHLNKLVGSASSKRTMQLDQIAHAFLRKPEVTAAGTQVELKPDSFAKDYTEFESFIAEDKYTAITVWPINGLRVEKPLRINEHVLIRPLTDEEISDCISSGIINVNQSYGLISDRESQYCGLEYASKQQKLIGDVESSLDEFNKQEQEKAQLLQDVQIVAALLGITNMRFGGRAEESQGWPSGFHMYTTGSVSTTSHVARFNLTVIDQKQAKAFKRTWNLMFAGERPKDQSLYLATRRLAFAEDRIQEDDRLLDLMISAEALYLSDTGSPQDKGELKFRLALRAASWADPSKISMTKTEVYKLMKNAYDARSSIAHGGMPAPKLLGHLGQEVTLHVFNKVVESVVHQGILKAVIATAKTKNKKFNPAWEVNLLKKLSR